MQKQNTTEWVKLARVINAQVKSKKKELKPKSLETEAQRKEHRKIFKHAKWHKRQLTAGACRIWLATQIAEYIYREAGAKFHWMDVACGMPDGKVKNGWDKGLDKISEAYRNDNCYRRFGVDCFRDLDKEEEEAEKAAYREADEAEKKAALATNENAETTDTDDEE